MKSKRRRGGGVPAKQEGEGESESESEPDADLPLHLKELGFYYEHTTPEAYVVMLPKQPAMAVASTKVVLIQEAQQGRGTRERLELRWKVDPPPPQGLELTGSHPCELGPASSYHYLQPWEVVVRLAPISSPSLACYKRSPRPSGRNQVARVDTPTWRAETWEHEVQL